jgi:predicted transcriptional regulator
MVGEQPGEPALAAEPELQRATPSQVRKSIKENRLVSFEDGRTYKTLRRHHLSTRGLTPEQYRQKHGLPADYPMVSPSYSARRSELAKTIGLGQKGGRRPATPSQEEGKPPNSQETARSRSVSRRRS